MMKSIRSRRLRLPLTILSVLALLALMYTLLVGVWLPRYLQRNLPGRLAQELQVQVHLKNLRIHPWPLSIEIDQLSVERQHQAILAWTHLQLRPLLWASLTHRAPVIGRIELDDPVLHLHIDPQGRVNLLDLVPPAAPHPAQAPASHMAWRIDHLVLHNGRIDFSDARVSPTLSCQIEHINLHLHDLGTLPDSQGQHHLQLSTSDGAQLLWQGEVHLAPLSVHGHLRLRQLDLAFWSRLSPQPLPLRLVQGRLGLDLDLDLPVGAQLPEMQHGQLSIEQLVLHDPAGRALLTLPAADIAGIQLSPSRHQARIESLSLQGGQLDLLRDAQGRLAMLPATSTTRAPSRSTVAPNKNAASAAWNWQLGLLAWQHGRIDLHDLRLPLQARMEDINFSVRGLNQDPSSALQLQLDSQLQQGHLQVQGQLVRQPLHADMDIQLAQMDLRAAQSLLARSTWIDLEHGQLASHGHLHYAASGPAALSYSGSLDLSHLGLSDERDRQPLLSWSEVRIPALDFSLQPRQLKIPRIELVDPYARLTIDRQRVANIATLMRPTAAQAARSPRRTTDQARAKSQPWPIHIGEIHIDNGAIAFADLSLNTPFAAGINALHGPIRHLDSNTRTPASVDLQGLINHYGQVQIAGRVNPLAAELFLDLGVHFHNVELSTLTPYAAEFAGYRIDQGKLDMDLHYFIEHRQLQAENQVRLNQLRLGQHVDSAEAVHLPLKLALALLRDADGNIDIDLPISGSLDNPDFKYGKLLWKVLLNLLEKAVTSPFRLLSGLVHGSDPEALKHIDFAAGSAQIDPAQAQKLMQLGQALLQRPALNLRIQATTDKVADTYGLQSQAFDAEWNQRHKSTNDELKALADWFRQLAGPARLEALRQLSMVPDPASSAAHPKLILNAADYRQRLQTAITQSLPLGPGALRELALARAQAIKSQLIEQAHVPDSRLYLVDPGHAQALADQVSTALQVDAP